MDQLRARLSKKYVVVERGPWLCWEFTGAIGDKGYGLIFAEGRTQRAHRVAYKVWVGEIGEGQWVLHRCDNPPCINPGHLFLGSAQDNSDDMIAKGRQFQPCPDQKTVVPFAGPQLTPTQVSKMYAIPLRTIQAACSQKRIDCQRVGRLFLIDPDDAAQYAAGWHRLQSIRPGTGRRRRD